MKKAISVAISLILVMSLLLAACAPAAAPITTPLPQAPTPTGRAAPAPAAVPAVPAKPAWEEQWEQAVEAAQKEGLFTFATSAGKEVQNRLTQGFKDKYGIRVESMGGPVGTLVSKILAERRAGLYLWDVLIGGASGQVGSFKPGGATTPMEPALILPDLTDPEVIKKVWYDGGLPWVDRDRHVIGPLRTGIGMILINTNLVKPGEIKAYDDLLNPRWKGKILIGHPVMSDKSAGSLMTMMHEVKGEDWLRKFVEQEPAIIADDRLAIDWLAHGKYAIYAPPREDIVRSFQDAGAPIAMVDTEDVKVYGIGPTATSLIDKAAHPNAAKVFLNWFLSKEGQTILSKVWAGQNARLDVPTEGLPAWTIIKPGAKKYWTKDKEETLLKINAYKEKSKMIFGPLLK